MPIKTKSIELESSPEDRLLEVHITGKLEKSDYELFAPEVERILASEEKVRMLVALDEFHGWTAGALWEDVKFDLKHFNDIDRLAIVGDARWEKGMAVFCRPFTTAEVRFFSPDQIDEARGWLRSKPEAS